MIRRLFVNLVVIWTPILLMLAVRIIMGKGAQIFGKWIPGIIILVFQISLLRKTTAFFVRERAKKFLATYKLMGLTQWNYTWGMLSSFYILSAFSLVPNVLLSNFIYKEIKFEFWIITFLFIIASTNYGVLFSVLIRNPNFASEMSSLFTFTFIFL